MSRDASAKRGDAMTEANWLAGSDPTPMLEFLRGKASDRKLRLITVAECHRIWNLLPVGFRTFAEVLEIYADGLVDAAEYRTAWMCVAGEYAEAERDPPDATTYAMASAGISDPPTIPSVAFALSTAAAAVASTAADGVSDDIYDKTYDTSLAEEQGMQARMTRDIFGNPFRPAAFDPAWRTSTVLALANGIYQEKAFDRLPILADALEDAGCDNADLLAHCRGDGEHVRGCWAVDLVLGKGVAEAGNW
jgi:hypothetical protein